MSDRTSILNTLATIKAKASIDDSDIDFVDEAVRQCRINLRQGKGDISEKLADTTIIDGSIDVVDLGISTLCIGPERATIATFIEAIGSFKEEEMLDRLSLICSGIIPPEVTTLNTGYAIPHNFTVDKKIRKARRKTTAEAPKTQPIAVSQLKPSGEAASIDKFYKSIRRSIVKHGETLEYMDLVIDTESFTKTVENIYNLSSLASEGKVTFDISEDSTSCIVGLPTEEDLEDTEEETEHLVHVLSYKDWEALAEKKSRRTSICHPE